MEPTTQEILTQLTRINKKITKLQDDIKEIKKTQNLLYSTPSNFGQIAKTFSGTEIQSHADTKIQDSSVTKRNAVELRPSRVILDQLSALNESPPFLHNLIHLSYYHTNFLIVDSSFLPYRGLYLNDITILGDNDYIALPFLLTDYPIFDMTFQSTSLYINEYEWFEKLHAYVITKDKMIQQVRSIEYNSLNVHIPYSQRVKVTLEPITVSLEEMLIVGKGKEVPILNVQCNVLALRKDAHEQTLLMLLLRVFLYSKAKDYLLDNQHDLNRNFELIEVSKHLTRLEQSTMMINGLRLSTELFNLSLSEMGFALHDLGDDRFALSMSHLFQERLNYLQGNRIDATKVTHILSEQCLYYSTDLDVEILSPMSSKMRKVRVFGLLVTEFDLVDGQNMLHLMRPKVSDRVRNYRKLLQAAQEANPRYNGNFHLVELNDKLGDAIHLHDIDFVIKRDEENFRAQLSRSIKVTNIKLAGGYYTFSPKSISRFIDLFFIYPQMLPYATELNREYQIGITKRQVVRVDGLEFRSLIDSVEPERICTGKFTMVQLNLEDGSTVSALRLRIPFEVNHEQMLVERYHHYSLNNSQELKAVDSFILDECLSNATLIEHGWNFYTYDGEPWARDIKLEITCRGIVPTVLPILTIPDGFTTWTQQYDLEYQQTVNVISSLIYRSSVHDVDIHEVKRLLEDVTNLVNHLVTAVNGLEKAFNNLQSKLHDSMQVPWWKKVLQGLVMVAGLVGTIVFPFSLPIAIGLISGSTIVQVGLMFADGDYLAGGIQLAGVLIGLGIGYYSFRKATSASYPIVNLEEARIIAPNEQIPGIENQNTDGMWIEVKPLNILNNKMEDVGKFMIKNTKGLLRTLMKFDNAPVHARVRSQTTRVSNGKTVRTTIVSGVTDGMPYLSHVNPRPGIYELFEVFENGQFINGWTAENAPIGGRFEDLGKSIQGLLIEGVGTDGEFQSLMRSWPHLAPDERAIAMNDAQDYIRKSQQMYTELSYSRIPISFDESLVRNVSNVFAKHTGIYELIGLGSPSGPNNCQTYSKELRDFFAKGALRQNKLNNTSFLNDLMDAFDNSVQFKHVYTPGLLKQSSFIRSSLSVSPTSA
nr:MAG: VP3 [Reoviridae sp.]